jgi:hypothetical protein
MRESAGAMAKIRERALQQQQTTAGRTRRVVRSLTRRARRRIFLPGDSLADGVKRACVFMVGWGAVIGLLTWAGYRQGLLHGVGDGITFAAVLFLLAVLSAPNYT